MNPRLVFWFAFIATLILGAIVYVALLTPARAAERWDDTDKVLGATALAFTAADWAQTRYLAQNPCINAGGGTDCADPYREVGLARHFIGERPTTGQVDRYFAGAIVVSALAAHYLPSAYRKWFLGGITLLELSVVANNRSIGLRMEF
jgi:hypothetical protein